MRNRWKALLALLLVALSFGGTTALEKFALYRVRPHDLHGLELLSQLQINDDKYGLDFWKQPHDVGHDGDVMVEGGSSKIFERLMRLGNVSFAVAVPDVERLIQRNEGKRASDSHGSRRLNDDPILDSEPDMDYKKIGQLKKAKYPFGDYASYADMIKYMRTIEFYYPKIAKIIRIGTTHEGKPIEGLKIGAANDSPKRAVWVDGNIHAREWASSHTALYFINQLVSEYGKDPSITQYIDKLDFYVVPCLNPDGYEYTRSSPFPSVRLWRKNRSPSQCRATIWGGEKCCQGVDLNRNFHFHWAERGSSSEPCSNIYQGEAVFSEPESMAVKNFLERPEMTDRLDAFVTLHSYAQLWIYPYSHEEQNYPEDIADLRKTARRAITKLSKIYGTQYRMGTGADTLSPASGGSDDWAKSALNVKYVYLIELRPEMELSNGFILHKKELIPTAVETFEGFREVVNAVLEHNGVPKSPIKKISASQRKKQQYRMRLLASQSTTAVTKIPTSSTTVVTSTSLKTAETTTTTHSSRLFARMSKKLVMAEEKETKRPTPPVAPPTMITPTTLEAEPSPEPTSAPTTTEASMASKRTTFGFYTQTKPASFADPSCRDMRYSCSFWLKHNADVCVEQESFMRGQCAFTCKFCTPFISRS
ncbi:unnamed protein product [Caenorhabditis auriculariae]|uniref:ShKT domain-containing protein n=1 Tax=Caenorhabditis auriculariae TaxID=2777116 RepID=A0A8S1GNV9_9PELO|nr:unnamed protein product [Caenorhabditis auriculariae]